MSDSRYRSLKEICDDPLGVKLTQEQMPLAVFEYQCQKCGAKVNSWTQECPGCGGRRFDMRPTPEAQVAVESGRFLPGPGAAEKLEAERRAEAVETLRIMEGRPPVTVSDKQPDPAKVAEVLRNAPPPMETDPEYRALQRKRLLEAKRLAGSLFQMAANDVRRIEDFCASVTRALPLSALLWTVNRLERRKRRILKAQQKVEALLAKAR